MTVIISVVARLLLAPSFVVAAAVLVKSSGDVGDGFSAGVIVVLAIALQYIALGTKDAETLMPLLRYAPLAAVTGLLVALGTGFAPVVVGEPPFSHLPPPGEEPVVIGTLELATTVLFDVGVFLLVAGGLSALLHHLAHGDITRSEPIEPTADGGD